MRLVVARGVGQTREGAELELNSIVDGQNPGKRAQECAQATHGDPEVVYGLVIEWIAEAGDMIG